MLPASQAEATTIDRELMTPLIGRINTQLTLLRSILENNGLSFKESSNHAWKVFHAYPLDVQIRIIETLEKFVSTVVNIQAAGIRFNESKKAIWHLFGQNRWRLDDNTFSDLDENDVVEVYLADGTQFFRNFNYFQYSSYTLADLIFCPWEDLIEHESNSRSELLNISRQIFGNGASSKKRFQLAPYIAQEKFSEQRFTAELTSKFISPIRSRDSGRNEAALVVWNIRLLTAPIYQTTNLYLAETTV